MFKLKKIASMLTAAVLSMTALCSHITANAVSRVSVHDPSVVTLEDGSYYIIGSHLGAARTDDLYNWQSAANSHLGSTRTTFFRDIYKDLAVPEKWSNTTNGYNLAGNLWAPDIIFNPAMGKYCMYLSVNGQQWNSSIVLCTADNIDGPYTYQGTIVYSGFTNNSVNNVRDTDVPRVLGNNPDISRYLAGNGWNASYGTNAIDPAVFYDENGKLWMIYGSWFGGLFMLELDENTGLRDYNVKYETKQNVSDAYMGIRVAGGDFSSGEGPYIEYMVDPSTGKGYYYLFVSYGYFGNNGGYNMRIFRSENPAGPYTDQNGNSAIFTRGVGDRNTNGMIGERLMSNYQWSCNERPYKAQGHNSALMDKDGRLYVVYHTKFDDAYGFHEVRTHQMFINEDGWLTAAPYEYTGEKLSENGHSVEAIVGEYEFIFHDPQQKFVNEQSSDVAKPQTISLNADGTVTGNITGSWTIKFGSPYMNISFGGVNYKGVFVVQSDESASLTKKMTFTATGNNTCIWGSKKSEYNAAADTVVYPEISEGYYKLQNVNSKLFIDSQQGNIYQSADEISWYIGKNEDKTYSVFAPDGKAITVENNNGTDGNNVSLAEFRGDNGQKFRIYPEVGGSYAFLSACSDFNSGLDVFEISLEDGANICQWDYWGGDGQKWILIPGEPVPQKIKGDVNTDGEFNLADLVTVQKWILGVPDAKLSDWQAANLCEDDRLDSFDLVMLRRLLVERN